MLNIFNRLPQMLLGLPAILLSLSIHESAHGYVAYKLGDPTARNLGRITLNPLKHINIYGLISMIFFNIGWANPVPIRSRNFKNPRKGMALSAIAGPASNLALAITFTILLRIIMIPLNKMAPEGTYLYREIDASTYQYYLAPQLMENITFVVLSLIAVMLYLGIGLNLNLMFFNMIPLPPLDGSRIAFIFLPTDTYFKIMQYERYIMIGFVVLLATGIVSLPLGYLTNGVSDILFKSTGMPKDLLMAIVGKIFNSLPQLSF